MQNFFLFLTKCVFYDINEYFHNFHRDTINEYFWLLYWTQMCSNPSEQNLNVLSSKNPTVKGDVCNLKTLSRLISYYQWWFMTQTLWFVLSQCIPYRKGGKVFPSFLLSINQTKYCPVFDHSTSVNSSPNTFKIQSDSNSPLNKGV